MDTALPQKFPFILDRNLAKANCTENRVCTPCDTVVLAPYVNGEHWPHSIKPRPGNWIAKPLYQSLQQLQQFMHAISPVVLNGLAIGWAYFNSKHREAATLRAIQFRYYKKNENCLCEGCHEITSCNFFVQLQILFWMNKKNNAISLPPQPYNNCNIQPIRKENSNVL